MFYYNREARRKINKQRAKKGLGALSRQDFDLQAAMDRIQNGSSDLRGLSLPNVFHLDRIDLFPDGTKVKLNLESIINRPVQATDDPTIVEWSKAHAQDILTLSRKDAIQGLVGVEEDDRGGGARKPHMFDLFTELLVWDEKSQDFITPEAEPIKTAGQAQEEKDLRKVKEYEE